MVKPSGDPETAALAVLWHYPPKPKNCASRHFDLSADPKNSCMRIVGRKLGIAGDLKTNIFMIERCSMRTEVRRVDDSRVSAPYNDMFPRDVVKANIAFRDNVVWFSSLSTPVVIQLGKENASDFEAMAKTDERVLLQALPDVPLYKVCVRDLLESLTLNVRGFRKIILSRAYELSTGSALPDTDLPEEMSDLARRWNAEGRGRARLSSSASTLAYLTHCNGCAGGSAPRKKNGEAKYPRVEDTAPKKRAPYKYTKKPGRQKKEPLPANEDAVEPKEAERHYCPVIECDVDAGTNTKLRELRAREGRVSYKTHGILISHMKDYHDIPVKGDHVGSTVFMGAGKLKLDGRNRWYNEVFRQWLSDNGDPPQSDPFPVSEDVPNSAMSVSGSSCRDSVLWTE
ncbi:hypothetical protein LTR17_018231 [Elasticomyces elasticus]|nr:hypothetical protein LTR17_018231 [Elasticomyces elasticus]